MTRREEDLVLIEKYLTGNEDAIEELVMKYQRQIYAFLYRMIYDNNKMIFKKRNNPARRLY